MNCYLKTQTDKQKSINVQTSYYCKLCWSCPTKHVQRVYKTPRTAQTRFIYHHENSLTVCSITTHKYFCCFPNTNFMLRELVAKSWTSKSWETGVVRTHSLSCCFPVPRDGVGPHSRGGADGAGGQLGCCASPYICTTPYQHC